MQCTIVRRTLLVHRVGGVAHAGALCNRARQPLHWGVRGARRAPLLLFLFYCAWRSSRRPLSCSLASSGSRFCSRSLHGTLAVFLSSVLCSGLWSSLCSLLCSSRLCSRLFSRFCLLYVSRSSRRIPTISFSHFKHEIIERLFERLYIIFWI